MHLTGGILRHFRAFSTPEQNPALEVSSTSAHPQVTQTVGLLVTQDEIKMINSDFQTESNITQPKKSNRKLWFLGCGGALILLCVILGAIGYYFLNTPSNDPLVGELSFPATVKKGDNFDFVLTLTNSTQNSLFLKHIVFFHLLDAPFLLDGVKVISVEPEMTSDLLNSKGDLEYAYFREIKPGETQTVIFHLQAEKPTTYAINVGIYAKHPSRPDPAYIQALHITGVEIEITP